MAREDDFSWRTAVEASKGAIRQRRTRRPVITPEIAHAAAMDAGNRSMRKGGRSSWSKADYKAAVEELDRLDPPPTPALIPVSASHRARAHERRVVLISFIPGVRGAERREEAWLATAPTKAELRRERQA